MTVSSTAKVSTCSLTSSCTASVAVGETVFLLHPPLPLSGISIGMERGCQYNDRTLADG